MSVGHRQPRAGQRHGRRARTSTTRCRSANTGRSVAGVRYDRYNASLTNSINLPPSASQSIGYTSVRAGADLPADRRAVVLRLLRHVVQSVARDARRSPAASRALDPETSRQYELGAKWDLLDGNLSLTAAIFEIEKDNTRSQISPGVYELTGRRPRARLPGERRRPHHARLAGLRRLHATSTPRSSRRRRSTARKGKVPANTPKQQRVDVDRVQPHARMAGRHRRRLHVGPVRVEQQRGQGRPTIFAGTRWSPTSSRSTAIQLNVFNLDRPAATTTR